MNRHILAYVAIFLVALHPHKAEAQTLSFSVAAKSIAFNYDYSQNTEAVNVLTVKHKGVATDIFVTFSTSQSSGLYSPRHLSAPPSTDVLVYEIYDDAVQQNVLKDLSGSPSANEVLSGTFAASASFQTLDLSYTILALASQFVAEGGYDDSYTITLYQGTFGVGTPTVADTVVVDLTGNVDSVVEVSVVATGAPFGSSPTGLLFDFGVMTANDSRTGDAIVRANGIFTLNVTSGNDGVMTLPNPADKSEVPYTFVFDGTARDLTGNKGVDVLVDQGPTAMAGSRYVFSITILDFGMASAGAYNDVITFTMTAQ
jgi:hypothetical protein